VWLLGRCPRQQRCQVLGIIAYRRGTPEPKLLPQLSFVCKNTGIPQRFIHLLSKHTMVIDDGLTPPSVICTNLYATFQYCILDTVICVTRIEQQFCSTKMLSNCQLLSKHKGGEVSKVLVLLSGICFKCDQNHCICTRGQSPPPAEQYKTSKQYRAFSPRSHCPKL